jgi:lysophospholipid acyltransferase (LPLAT)-like uncharacterized protein
MATEPKTREQWAVQRRQVTADRTRAGRDAPWRRRWRILRRRAGGLLLPLAAPPLLRALSATWRVRRLGQDRLDAVRSGPGFLASLWHGRMLPALALHRGHGLHVLVSPSDDGGLVSGLLRRFGYHVLRGSTSKGGVQAMRAMRGLVRGGAGVVITPDGPRGPLHAMNVGLAWLSRETGMPILPTGLGCDRAWRLRSWDRFLIPKPRARVVVAYGEPCTVPPDASDADLDRVTEQVRAQMLALEEAAFRELGVPRDW